MSQDDPDAMRCEKENDDLLAFDTKHSEYD